MGDRMKKRGWVLFFVFIWVFLGMIGRLTYVSLGKNYQKTAVGQSSFVVVVDTPRGTVFDRTLAPITNRSWVEKTGGVAGGLGVLCKQTFSTVQPACHLVGYLQENRGVSGLQKGYDPLLSGAPTTLTYVKNGAGGILPGLTPTLLQDLSVYEKGVVTTLWLPLQQAAERVFPTGARGTVVISRVASGEILAGASFPAFSPLAVSDSLTNTASPFVNRMLTPYNVGSVFKLVVAAAALEQGISPEFSYTCTGKIQAGQEFSCHKQEGHGGLNMREALAVSCNPYFIHLAETVGAQAVMQMAISLGFGISSPLCEGIAGEGGSLPKEGELARSPAALANFAIGQGELLATPLHIQALAATVANGGVTVPLHLVLGTRNEKGEVTYEKGKEGRRVMSKDTAHTLQEMMQGVLTQGTGAKGYYAPLAGGGKTSTAQTGMVNPGGQGITQAWFTGFLPAHTPQYAVTILVKGGSSGGDTAAPIFYELCKTIEQEGLLRK